MTNEPQQDLSTPHDPTPDDVAATDSAPEAGTGPGDTVPPESSPDNADRIPPITVEWVAQPGDLRRASLSVLRQRRFWVRSLVIGLVVGVIVAAVCIATGSGWPLGLLIGGCFFLGLSLEILLICLFAAWRQNRKVLRAGTRWAAGSDATRIRIDNRINTIIIARSDIEGFRRVGSLFVLQLPEGEVLAIPAALLESTLTDPAFARLID
ncbi:LapA family protein [Tsukamurella tyrosinosolvens]|uniref:YcxB-like protein n=1 Tax=Tsukamurella tyrosinosolvens TaxID=57704 RepID=A0A1H4L206_TSUTY|nr:LapA family protein [Tsukamurella tyrosinosolvens]AUN38767.1 hypothetical protein ASU32_01065 [Tsukamurella tyrosinosolvens]KXO96479.1 hypothetical protein AXK58_04060 [Tsukamurella tyrosinosolvens]KXP01158.1 hypothetical protein AXK59_22950 [Tsukamurella tyrosinosolvens]KZL94619.1 hypothetical protein AXX05_09285 [Tsukamurella tyrosinosolvens]MCA4997335.1 LapA family protein [Tsukamurella tyrosinosolvens]